MLAVVIRFSMYVNEIKEVVIPQRRLLSLFCGILLLCMGLELISVPILTFFIPIDATYEEQLYFKGFSFVIALVLGCPLVIMSRFLITNVGHNIAIRVNREGMYIHTDAFKKGFISWTAVERIHFYKSHMIRRFGRTLEVILNTDEKPAVQINAVWRVHSNVLHTYDGQRLLISFSFCKGNAHKNACNIIDFWENYIMHGRLYGTQI